MHWLAFSSRKGREVQFANRNNAKTEWLGKWRGATGSGKRGGAVEGERMGSAEIKGLTLRDTDKLKN